MSQKHGLMAFILDPRKEFAYWDVKLLRGINIKYKENTVLMIVKVTDNRGNHEVAFIEGRTLYDCWSYLYDTQTKRGVPITYRPDRYA